VAAAADDGGTAFVVLAGGSGSRVGTSVNKVYLPLAGRRVVSWSFVWAREVPQVDRFVLVARREDLDLARRVVADELAGLPVQVIEGGASRHGSEQAALDHLAPDVATGRVRVVALHDAARPLAGPRLVRTVVTTAASVGGAVPAVPAEGLLAVDAAGHPQLTCTDDALRPAPRPHLARVQTPQAFRAPGLIDAYAAAGEAGFEGTDTASSVEAHGHLAVRIVPGSRHNLKVTFPPDLALAGRVLAAHAYRLP
jgi:2-C-methyl-D-erythritol 4-phosphate cytidylyltransferase